MGTIGNINVRVGADASPLTEEMKKAQNTILTFKNESMTALKSFGLPNINSTNLVESIQSGQRTVVNFARESGETLAQFQQRVRATFQEAGIDVTQYEKVLQNATQVHAEFAKGAVKNFQAVTDSGKEATSKTAAAFEEFKGKLSSAFQTMTDSGTGFGEKIFAAGELATSVFPELMAAIMAVEFVKRIAEWTAEMEKFAQEVEDVQHRFVASTGVMSDQATEFSENLSKKLGVGLTKIKDEMGKEYLNTRMLGFDPQQAEQMSEGLVKLSYDLGKLRGEDPSAAFDKLKMGVEGQTKGLSELGIRITNTDIQQKALTEGLIKHGQVLTDQQKSLVIYQDIMQKTAGVQGYYATTTNDLSTQNAKLSAGWEEMKEKLATALTPAFTELLKAVNFVAGGIEWLVEEIATGIQYITLFVEDVSSAVSDIYALDFSKINEQWQNNYDSIFNSNNATKQFGESLDTATSAANAQDAAQQKLGKTLRANVMSFDQLHNITKDTSGGSGGGGASVSSPTVANPTVPSPASSLNKDQKGIIIPIKFGPIPPFPKLPKPDGVTVPVRVLDPDFQHALNIVKNFVTELGKEMSLAGDYVLGLNPDLSTSTEKVRQWETANNGLTKDYQTETGIDLRGVGNSLGNLSTAYSDSAITVNQWSIANSKTAGNWQMQTINDLHNVNLGLNGLNTSLNTSAITVNTWSIENRAHSKDYMKETTADMDGVSSSLGDLDAGYSDSAITVNQWKSAGTTNADSYSKQVITDMNNTKTSVDNLAGSFRSLAQAQADAMQGISTVVNGISNVAQNVGNWASNHQELLGAIGTGIAVGGVTLATGGLDLLPAGVAAAGSALAGIGASLAPSLMSSFGMATGGIVNSPQIHMIGEAGPEAVIPLDRLNSIIGGTGNSSGGGGDSNSGQPIILHSEIKLDGRTLARHTSQYNTRETDRISTVIGYHPAYNYPG